MKLGEGVWPWLVAASAALASPAAAASLTEPQTREVVEQIASRFADTYVFADRAQKVARYLRARATAGDFRATRDPKELAAALTATIRRAEPDKHIEVVVAAPPNPTAQSQADRYAWIDRLRRRNFDFIRVERLPGNVGYLKLNSFPPPEIAAKTAQASMAFLRNSDALIVDLRDNGGGAGEMSQLLASYFFVERTPLLQTFRRAADPHVTLDYTLTQIEGERMPAIDLFVLTSESTFSAAEAFAFALQQRGRAMVVGEITKGGANAGRYIDLPHGFRIFIPVAHASSPATDKSWDGVGVQPDIRVPAATALQAAYREALQRLLSRASDPNSKTALKEALETSRVQ